MRATWFCDVDGAIAPTGKQHGRRYEVFHVGGWNGSALVDLDVIEAIRWLLTIDAVDFRWCSNWEAEAPMLLAPALGLPDLPMAAPPSREGGWWKETTVRDHAATGAPFIWTDDEIDRIGGGRVDDLRSSGLVISTSARFGLTVDDVARIEAYALQIADA